jgi:hypothetical protein
MRRYAVVSGAFFSLFAFVQLTRVALGWSVQVATVAVPVWASVIACLVTASLAIWGFRTSRGAA